MFGISLGTRSYGYAVVKDGELLDWGVKTVGGKWNKKKLKKILHTISVLADVNGVTMVAIKIPDPLPVSKGFMQLIGALNVLFEGKSIPKRYVTLTDLKLWYCNTAKANKIRLLEAIRASHPELSITYPDALCRNTHGIKAFEAVAAAHC